MLKPAPVSVVPGNKAGWLAPPQPVLQQALAAHLVSLDLNDFQLDSKELISICGFTKLTQLRIKLPPTNLPDNSVLQDGVLAVAALSSLQQLHSMSLTGHAARTSHLMHLDLSPLAQLTSLHLCQVQCSFALASTAPCLKDLVLLSVHIKHGQSASNIAPGLAKLEVLGVNDTRLQQEDLQLLQQLPLLQDLGIEYMPEETYALFGGAVGFCNALGRLTMLTSLYMRFSG